MKRRGRLEPALHDHAVAGADAIVARRTVNVVPLATAFQQSPIDHERDAVDKCPRFSSAGEQGRIIVEMTARDSSVDRRALRSSVLEECARPQWPIFGLVLHVIATAGECE